MTEELKNVTLAANEMAREIEELRAENARLKARINELETPKSRKRAATKDEFGSEGGRVVCLDCDWSSRWFNLDKEYGGFRSASHFHQCGSTGGDAR